MSHFAVLRRRAAAVFAAAATVATPPAAFAGASQAAAASAPHARAASPGLNGSTAGPAGDGSAAGTRVLRLGFGSRENSFDPAQVSDVVSAALVASLFDAPLTYDHLARPAKLVPNTAAALPEVHDDHRRFVFTIKPGIHFADHPAFGGRPRELTAADYVYSVKRYYDPAVRSPTLFHYESAGLLGLSELRRKALSTGRPFDYDTEVAGIRALDRYRFEVRVADPAPRLPYVFATAAVSGAVAREVVESDPKRVGEQPVGTGPFVLGAWTRGSKIVLERSPSYRRVVYDAEPPAGDAAAQAVADRLRGRRLPLLDRVEISIVEEAQPRWLSFLNGQLDMVQLPNEFVTVAAPNGTLAPNLARRGMQLHRQVSASTLYTYFNMDHPVVGGTAPDRVALRRAIGLAYDARREIDLVRRGQALPAQSLLPPGVSGHDPTLKSEASDHDVGRAKALLDLYGYVDRDGDGWRDRPDGSPLTLELAAQPEQASRQLQGLWQKAMRAVDIRIAFRIGAWQENIKASRAGKLMMWSTGWSAAIPDGSYFLGVLYGPNVGQSNHARFALPAFDRLHERQRAMPDGPERDRLIADAMRLSLAYLPVKPTAHPIDSWITADGVGGFRPHPYLRDYWRTIDVDPAGGAKPSDRRPSP